MADNLSIYLARLAVVDHFDQAYGKDVVRIAAWQELCRDVGAEVRESISKCKKNLKGIFVNIVDFVAAKEAGTAVRTFASAKALSGYIRKEGRSKVFPLRMAKENQILRWMLITLR